MHVGKDVPKYVEFSVTGCSACGKYHNRLQFAVLEGPVLSFDGAFPYRGTCPTDGTAIYARDFRTVNEVVDDPDEIE